MGYWPKYDSKTFETCIQLSLLEPIAVVSRDYGICGDNSILPGLFCERKL
jgi:hypothetical protein